MPKKQDRSKWIRPVLFLLGLLLCSYPLISGIVQRQYQKDAVATYEHSIGSVSEEEVKDWKKDAKEYNDRLYQAQGLLIGGTGQELLSNWMYNKLLNINGDGIMASIDIPKIDVSMPVYHGVSNEVLSIAAGHVEGSSLPVGGVNTRAVISAHRGLPNAKLFTRLDELVEGDYFFIHVLDEVLAYEVIRIEVILPSEVDSIQIMPEQDLVSLLTCTPYGLNTHRLVVTGERVPYESAEYTAIQGEVMSLRELVFAAVPFFFLGIAIYTVISDKRKRGKSN